MRRSYTDFHLAVGSFVFKVSTNISQVVDYLDNHYDQCQLTPDSNTFVDYSVRIKHGSILRRFFRPQAIFEYNFKQPFKPLPIDQAHAMLEWGMNWVISGNAHQYLVIHAATLEKNGKGIIISASSGSGKSTLCAYLVSRGWRLLSDELALISLQDGLLYGLGRPINLKNHSIELMRPYFNDDQFSQIAMDTHKGEVSLLKAPAYMSSKAHIGVKATHLVFVKYNASEKCHVEPVSKCLALTEIIQNSFNFGLLGVQGFKQAKTLVDQSNAVYIEYNNFEACEKALLNAIHKG